MLKTTKLTTHMFPLGEVGGTAYEMGYQHGAQAKELVERYLVWTERLTNKSRDVLARNAMAFLPHIAALSPPMVDEIRGLADGTDISFEEAVLCQARAEAAQVPEGGCTAFALTGDATVDGNPLAGQNQDLEPEYADVAILLRVKPTDGRPRALMFTFAGQLGFSGMNEHGVANFTNALYGCDWQPGLPHYPQKPVMLEQRTVADCIDVLRKNPACSARNMVMADGQGTIADVEIRPESISEFTDDADGWRIHTNHYLTDEFQGFEDNTLPDSPSRFDRMRSLVGEHWGDVTVEHLKDFFGRPRRRPGRDLPSWGRRPTFDLRLYCRARQTSSACPARTWMPGIMAGLRCIVPRRANSTTTSNDGPATSGRRSTRRRLLGGRWRS